MRRPLCLLIPFISVKHTVSESIGAAGMDGFYNAQNDDLIENNAHHWNDHDGHEDEETTTPVPIEELLDPKAIIEPQGTVIYTCGGTARDDLPFCQFPFSTLAGNEYTDKCADQVEDNPDVSVDRPWCFVSATDWGFCDCTASLDFSHLVSPDPADSTKGNIAVQVTIDYPATTWCYLEGVDAKAQVGLAHLMNGTVVGGSTVISAAMIRQAMVASISFTASLHTMQANPVLACSANCTGVMTNPETVKMVLGTRPDETDNEDPEPDSTRPRLLTRTSGALVYSIVILMLLGSIIGARYALGIREKMMFSILNEVSVEGSTVHYGLPLQVITK